MKGQESIRYHYDYNTRLYEKNHVSNISSTFNDLQNNHLQIPDFLTGFEFVTDPYAHSFLDENITDTIEGLDLPMHLSYLTPDTICFTRKSNDVYNSFREHDLVLLNRLHHAYQKPQFGNAKLRIFIHHPGQLLRSLNTPVFESKLSNYGWTSQLIVEILGVTLLRRRPESNYECNTGLEDDDIRILLKISELVGCIPVYWTHILANHSIYQECRSQQELRSAYHYIERYKEVISSLDPPCTDMNPMSIHYPSIITLSQLSKGVPIKFQYRERSYQEIENLQEFNFESFLSGIGGYVGIFLGYSIMQFPELITNIQVAIGNIKLYYWARNV